jgi:hypothetical protein
MMTIPIVERLVSVAVLSGLADSLLVHVLELADLAPVVLSLEFEDLNFLVKVSGLQAEVAVDVALLGVVLVETEALEVAVVQQSLLPGQLLLQIMALLVPTRKNRY